VRLEVSRLAQLLHEPLPDSPHDPYVAQLAETGGLDEAELLEVCHAAMWRSCGLLLDNRYEMSLPIYGNAVLLVVHEVTSSSSEFPVVATARRKWTVAGSSVKVHRRGVDVRLEIYPRVGSVTVSGAHVSLYDLEIEGLETLADYGDPEDVVVANMPAWTSRARIRGLAQLIGPGSSEQNVVPLRR